jgi:catechol 2,3-dioxygenase-like lactoylglutathione lyase family enzyme
VGEDRNQEVAEVDWKLENVLLPVADVDRAKSFYERAGFALDVDHQPNDAFRVVQFTPPGSACSVTFGIGITSAEPGSVEGLHLVVTDVEAARAELVGRGIDVSDPYHFGPEGQAPGVDPTHADFSSYVSFNDPDGNSWLIQERGYGTE